MRFYRTIAGVGAAALVFLALSRVSRRAGWLAGESREEMTGRERVVVRGRMKKGGITTEDVI